MTLSHFWFFLVDDYMSSNFGFLLPLLDADGYLERGVLIFRLHLIMECSNNRLVTCYFNMTWFRWLVVLCIIGFTLLNWGNCSFSIKILVSRSMERNTVILFCIKPSTWWRSRPILNLRCLQIYNKIFDLSHSLCAVIFHYFKHLLLMYCWRTAQLVLAGV